VVGMGTYLGKTVIITNPYSSKSSSYKGALHAHTTNSDGDSTPTVLETTYRDSGYSFISVTDHDFITPDPSVSGILHVNGYEAFTYTDDRHINAWNVSSKYTDYDAQGVLDHIASEGGVSSINHPSRGLWTNEELQGLRDVNTLEIYNYHNIATDSNNEDYWDYLLTKGFRIWGTAVDDLHVTASEVGRGYVVVNADSLGTNDIMSNIKNGNFYASTGATVSVSLSGQTVTATTSSAGTIEFITSGGTISQSTPSATSASYAIVGNEKYVRVNVTRDSDGAKAWAQPIFLDLLEDSGSINNRSNVYNAALEVRGSSDTAQLVIRESSTQTYDNPHILLQDSSGAEVARFYADIETYGNLFIGLNAGKNNTETPSVPASQGVYNTFIGSSSGASNITGRGNTGLGNGALWANTTGTNNTAVGLSALALGTEGWGNVGIGEDALMWTGNASGGDFNASLGTYSLYSNTSGNGNVAIGHLAGGGAHNGEVGVEYNVTGSNNIFIGYQSRPTTSALQNAMAIGYEARVSQNNSLVLGGTGANAVSVGIGTTAPIKTLEVSGDAIFADQSSLGTEKLTNGTFTGSATGWTVGSGWAYSANTVVKNADGTAALSQSSASMATPLVAGETYLLSYTLSNRTAGSVTPSVGGVTLATQISNATHKNTFVATSTADLAFTPSSTARFTIDNISLKKITGGDVIALGNVGIGTAAPGSNLDIISAQTSGDIISIEAQGSQALTGNLTAEKINLMNFNASGRNLRGQEIYMPAVTNSGSGMYFYSGTSVDGGSIIQNTLGGTTYWTGYSIGMPDITQTTGTVVSRGIAIAGGTVNSGTAYAMTTDAAAGNVGIGTDSPDYRLEVNTDTASSYAASFLNDGNNANRYGVRIQTGEDTPSGNNIALQVADGDGTEVGSITFDGTQTYFNTASDVRLKENIVDTALGMDTLMNIKVRDYNMRSDQLKRTVHGVVAQELLGVYPDAVVVPEDTDKMMMVDYSKLTPLIIKSIQQQQDQINMLSGGDVVNLKVKTAEVDKLIVVGDTTFKGTLTVNGKVIFNGAVTANEGLQLDTKGPKPVCDINKRGTLWVTQGGTGIEDITEICIKGADDVYLWKRLY